MHTVNFYTSQNRVRTATLLSNDRLLFVSCQLSDFHRPALPGRGPAAGRFFFGSALLQPARSVCWALFHSETVLGFRWRFQNSFMPRSSDMMSPWYSNLENYQVAIVPFQSLADSFHRGIVFALRALHVSLNNHCWDTCNARRAQCILLYLLLRLTAVGCTLLWTLEAEINKQLQLLQQLPLKVSK